MDPSRDAVPLQTAPAAGRVLRDVQVCHGGDGVREKDWLVEEVPIELCYDGTAFAVLMATPTDLHDLAIGFALSEGHLADAAAIRDVTVAQHLEGVRVDIATDGSVAAPVARAMPARSGCGLCGSRQLEDVLCTPAPLPVGPRLHVGALDRALGALDARQVLNAGTGAAHAAAWATPAGEIVCVREDVGRHNALDKLLGALRRAPLDPSDGFALVTSRASYEMVLKAARLRVAVLAAISAPTALGVTLAHGCNLTLVGFARPGRHVVYSHAQRLPGA